MAVQTSYSTNLSVAFEGQKADSGPCDVWSMVNNEASAEIPFGHAVAFEGSTDDQGALSPDNTADVIAGLVLHSHDYSNSPTGELGSTGLKPGAALNVLRRGRIWARCQDGCAPGNRLFVAVGTGADPEGSLRATADGANTIDSQGQGMWLTTAAAGALAVLEVDFMNDAADAT